MNTKVITLNNKKDYLVLNEITVDNVTYYIVLNLNDEKESKILEVTQKKPMIRVKEVSDTDKLKRLRNEILKETKEISSKLEDNYLF